MKYLLTLLLGLGAVAASSCAGLDTAAVQQDQSFTLAVSGAT